mmetsp:Transcript_102903/g.193577  ORF Transcript_102903/g.193577 Transcript_102903/m.193577 type:complete len:343 (-) Transcript_102903:49-1077(-)
MTISIMMTVWRLLFQRSSAILACLVLCGTAAPPSFPGWHSLPQTINNGAEASYLGLVSPALQAIRLSYTATFGSYRKTQEVNGTLGDGWERFQSLERNPRDGGFHGLVFWHAETRQLVLAMRGTDLDPTGVSGQADSCADQLLWDNATYDSLPAFCRQFSREDLDYFSAAEAFADRALDLLKPSATLFVGHSLGAGLSVMVAARQVRAERWQPQVLGVSAPTFDAVLKARVNRDPEELQADRYVVIYDVFDPLFRVAQSSSGVRGSTVCTYTPFPSISVCVDCFSNVDDITKWNQDPRCLECFSVTHVLKYYLHHLQGTLQKPPEYRPRCELLGQSSTDVVV